MGYRSDVEIVVYAPEKQFVAWIAGLRLSKPELFKDMEQHAKILETSFEGGESPPKYLMMHVCFDNVKWYPSYTDVDRWEDMLLDIRSNYKESVSGEELRQMEFEVCICGEDIDDITFRHTDGAYFVLDVQKYSELNWPVTETDYFNTKEKSDAE